MQLFTRTTERNERKEREDEERAKRKEGKYTCDLCCNRCDDLLLFVSVKPAATL